MVRKHQSAGTAFTLDRDGRQYMISALHVTGSEGDIEIYHDGEWKKLRRCLVGADEKEDVSVFSLLQTLGGSPVDVAEATTLGQHAFFLGFPFGMHTESSVNLGYPIPFVKSGVLSGYPQTKQIWIDAHGNKGFSGGPLVVRKDGNELFAGVVRSIASNTRTNQNEGFVVATTIGVATDIIDSNPIGFPLDRRLGPDWLADMSRSGCIPGTASESSPTPP